jgi:hypothetical protein
MARRKEFAILAAVEIKAAEGAGFSKGNLFRKIGDFFEAFPALGHL